MNSSRYFINAILYIMIIIFGFVTKGMGRPLNTAVFTLHKLTALAFVICTVKNIVGLLKNAPTNAFMWITVIMSGLLVIALFASGVILSFEKPASKVIYIIHNTSTILLVISIGLTYYAAAKKL